jgi:hypothetical protein
MTHLNYLAPAELYLGTTAAAASEQGPRAFRTAAHAIRFAVEHAAPVSLHGARLVTPAGIFSGAELKTLHRDPNYPLPRTRN